MWSDVLRGTAQRAVLRLAEEAWAAGAWVAGRMLATGLRPATWASGGGARILVVAAHADDETVGAGGAICLHAAAGDEVALAVVTDGAASRAGGLDAGEMSRRRRAEAEEAAGALGVRSLVCLGLAEGTWEEREAEDRLRPLVAAAGVVYAPSCVDYHPEHLRVARVVAGLVASDQIVRVYEVGVPLTPVLANLVVHIAPVVAAKERALAAFETQRASLAPATRLARYRARLYGGEDVEVFWEVRGDAYARAIRAGDWSGGPTPFRGIRSRSLTDPLAALVGLGKRRALRRAAQGRAG